MKKKQPCRLGPIFSVTLSAIIALGLGWQAQAEGGGKTLADSGFRPKTNGFSFENWSGDQYPYANLTPNDLVILFGDRVCARWDGDKCVPTPGATLWIEKQNAGMRGGHCEGMAALSSAFHVNTENPGDYGASPTFSLKPEFHELMSTISRYFVTQSLDPVAQNTRASQQWPLKDIVSFLVDNIKSKKDYVTLGIYANGSGHAITPYMVEETGPSAYRVHVYDNNYPGQEKFVDIDAGKDQWVYAAAAINPSEDPAPWQGAAGSMDVTLLSTRYESLICPFCGEHAPPRSPRPAKAPKAPKAPTKPSPSSENITVETPARCSQILIAGKKDKKQFSVGKVKKNEIKGASMTTIRGSRGCNVRLPGNQEYDFRLVDDGRPYSQPMTDVYMYVPGNVYSISDVAVSQGTTQGFTLGADVFTFLAGGSQKPTIRIAGDRAGSNGYYEVSGFTLTDGYTFTAEEDADGKLSFSDNDPSLDNFDLRVEEVSETGTENHEFDDVDVGDKGEAVVDLDATGGVDLGVDSDSDGTLDEKDADDDNDGTPDAKDTDDDGDGTSDDKEVVDIDHDGTPDANDTDDDNDGTLDTADTDDDNDGTPDTLETADADHDGTPDSSDADDDNDGTPDAAEADDADHDGTPDSSDTDDDNDGTPDAADADDDNDGTVDTQDGDAEAADTNESDDGAADDQGGDDGASDDGGAEEAGSDDGGGDDGGGDK